MNKIYLIILFSLLVLVGCGNKPLDMERIESDVLSRTSGSNLIFLEDVPLVQNDDLSINYTNKISHNSNTLKVTETINLNYIYDKKEREWIVDSYITKFDHYTPLVHAHEAQPVLTNELGFAEQLSINEQSVNFDDPYVTCTKVDHIFDGSTYSDYIYDLTYDNGAVSASATYKISYKFEETRGEWYFVENKLIKDFELITSLKLDDNKTFNEMFREYFVVNSKGILNLVGDDSNIKYALSLTDASLDINVESDIILDGLDSASVDVQLLKEDSSFDIDTRLRVYLLLDDMRQSWTINAVKPLVNQTSITLSDKFIGSWEGYYRLRDDEYKATLEINSLINNNANFEGVITFGSSDTFDVEDGSFTIIGGFINDELIIELSEWIEQPHRVKAYNIFIDDLSFNEDSYQMSGHMTWQSSDDYKAIFIKN